MQGEQLYRSDIRHRIRLPRVLKEIMNKRVDLDHAREMAEYCHKIELPIQCYFVIGNPGGTKEEINMTIDFAASLYAKGCVFSIATPFPGTNIMNWRSKKAFWFMLRKISCA